MTPEEHEALALDLDAAARSGDPAAMRAASARLAALPRPDLEAVESHVARLAGPAAAPARGVRRPGT